MQAGANDTMYYQTVNIYKWDLSYYDINYTWQNEITIVQPTIEEIEEIYHKSDNDLNVYSLQYLYERIQSGAWECMAAKKGSEILGYVFRSAVEMYFKGSTRVNFLLPSSSIYVFRHFVLRPFRNMSIGKALTHAVLLRARNALCQSAFSAVDSHNSVQIHNYEKMGGENVGSVRFLKTFFSNLTIFSPGLFKNGLKLRSVQDCRFNLGPLYLQIL
jgi:ribosomal protein S18 acetylase RimI-like enzyme